MSFSTLRPRIFGADGAAAQVRGCFVTTLPSFGGEMERTRNWLTNLRELHSSKATGFDERETSRVKLERGNGSAGTEWSE